MLACCPGEVAQRLCSKRRERSSTVQLQASSLTFSSLLLLPKPQQDESGIWPSSSVGTCWHVSLRRKLRSEMQQIQYKQYTVGLARVATSSAAPDLSVIQVSISPAFCSTRLKSHPNAVNCIASLKIAARFSLSASYCPWSMQ